MLCCDNNFAVSFQIECDPKMDQNHGGGGDGSAASSNQSKRSLVNKTPEPCLVCGVPTSTLHLQVCWEILKLWKSKIRESSIQNPETGFAYFLLFYCNKLFSFSFNICSKIYANLFMTLVWNICFSQKHTGSVSVFFPNNFPTTVLRKKWICKVSVVSIMGSVNIFKLPISMNSWNPSASRWTLATRVPHSIVAPWTLIPDIDAKRIMHRVIWQ